jgi:nicotinamidase-related amidase
MTPKEAGMPKWNDFLTERDKLVFAKAGFGAVGGFGHRPVVVVVDVSYGFCGERPMPILESIEEWHSSCGHEAWDAVARIAELTEAARLKRVPVIYTTGPEVRDNFQLGRWVDKTPSAIQLAHPRFNEIVTPIAPVNSDLVILKSKPSAFFGTDLTSYLIDLQADTVITCGTTTSGCVRATVVDGFSYNYRMIVVEECTFDRGEASHWINLFDMHQKYADVTPLAEVIDYFETLDDAGLASPVTHSRSDDTLSLHR